MTDDERGYDPAWRGRTRVQVEQDVLASMFLVEPFRKRASAVLHARHFTTTSHIVLFSMTSEQIIGNVEAILASTMGCPIDDMERWLLRSSPVTYDEDLQLLTGEV